MAPIISTLLHLTAFKSPFLATLVPSIAAAYGIQAAFAVPSILAQSERFYDLSGSLTYLSCTALSLYLPTIRARYAAAAAGRALPPFPSILSALKGVQAGGMGLNWRQVFLSAAVTVWATRLGTFLFRRITSENGRDSRFDSIRSSPPKFLVAFFAQATWVSLVLMPVLAVNAIPASAFAALGGAISITDIIGVALWVGGLSFEATADAQKSKWATEKKEKKHSEEFLTRGLWSRSRHPNYFGEVTLWTGVATLATGVLASSAGQATIGLGGGIGGVLAAMAIAGVSPAFTSFLLFKVSGIPMSEKKYDEKFKGVREYERWKEETPMFFPVIFKKEDAGKK